jgi:hypothetical protein
VDRLSATNMSSAEVISIKLVVICIPSITVLLHIVYFFFNNLWHFYPTTCLLLPFMQLYLQIGQNLFNSINLMALLDLFEVIVKKPFFYQLRWQSNLNSIFFLTCDNENGFSFQLFYCGSSFYFLNKNRVQKHMIRLTFQ